MTKADLIGIVAQKAGINHIQATNAVDAVFDSIRSVFISKSSLRIPGFMIFSSKTRKEMAHYNPKTHERYIVPETIVPTVKFSQNFLNVMKRFYGGYRAETTFIC